MDNAMESGVSLWTTVTALLNAVMLDMLEFQYELGVKGSQVLYYNFFWWYSAGHNSLSLRGIQYTWN